MRNLKRALSLTLASVMLLGMMVIGTSAAAGYDDVKENDNVEAIEVLQAVEVMVGDDRGFGPDRPVTRAEMAVVMGKLLNLDYNYYVSTCPFADVSGNFDWAKGWVGACAANGIVSGRGDGIYDPAATVTAVEAASMMMRALGYFKHVEDYADGFQVVTVRQGSQIGIFNGVGTNATNPMTRNQVAQMALNALRSNMVDFTGTLGVEINGVKIGYQGEYTFRTGTEAKYRAISPLGNTTDGTTNQSYIQLGEELYNGKLKLNTNAEDAFDRPARKWEYDGKGIGTYAKEELIRSEYTTEVTGKDLYDLLGADTIKTYDIDIAIDGVDTKADNAKNILEGAYFTTADMNRNNDKGVGATGNGVLTQVFVDDDRDEVTIAIINTYLAFADEDYDTRTEEVDITAYGLDIVSKEYVKTLTSDNDYVGFTLPVEDFAMVADVKDGDPMLVTVAEGAVQSVAVPEVLASAEITAFKKNSNVTVDGTKYSYSSAAEYDWKVLDKYTGTGSGIVNLKDVTYNVYLDRYGYAIGVDVVDAVNNYVFISAIQRDGSHLTNLTANANAIFLDGTMKTVKINVAKSTLPATSAGTDSILNSWCTYSVTDDVYTIKEVARATQPSYAGGADINTGVPGGTTNGTDIAQAWTKSADVSEINRTHLSLNGGGNTTVGYSKVYGNDDTVYITVKLDELDHDSDGGNGTSYGAISDVNSVITGVRNADLKVWSQADALKEAEDSKRAGTVGNNDAHLTHGVYSLYGKDGYVIAAVVAGDDGASTKNLVYVHSSSVDFESYEKVGDQWTWSREVTLDGKKTDITEVSDSLTYLENMQQHHWYQVRYNSKGEVIGIADWSGLTTSSPFTAVPDWSLTTATVTVNNDQTITITEGDYVRDIRALEACLDEYDNVLYEQTFTNDHPTMDVKKGNTLYVTTKTTEGIWVNDDVNILLVQYEKNKLVTTFTDGASRLDKIVRDLNSKNGTTYNYTISAVVDGTGATTVVIYDRTNTYEAPEEITDHKVTATYDGFNTFDITVSDTCVPNYVEIADAIKKELEGANWNAKDVTVTFDTNGITEVTFTTPAGVPVTLKDGSGLTIDVVNSFKLDNEVKEVDFSSFTAGSSDVANLINAAEGGNYDADTALAETPYSKVTFQNPKTGAKTSKFMALSDTFTATELVTLVSIETGYLTADGLSAEEAAELVKNNIDNAECFTKDNYPIQGSNGAIAPNVTTSISGSKVTLTGEYTKNSSIDYTQAPWYYPAGNTGEKSMLVAVGFYGPKGAKGATTGNGVKYSHATQLDLLMGVLVPLDTKKTTFEIQWYVDEACTIPMGGAIEYTFDGSAVKVKEAPTP